MTCYASVTQEMATMIAKGGNTGNNVPQRIIPNVFVSEEEFPISKNPGTL